MDFIIKESEIEFKYKFIEGSTNKSFGVNIAKLVGLDNKII